jgi:hypothetical protein
VAEKLQADWELGAAVRTKPAEAETVYRSEWMPFESWQVGYVQPDPNRTVDELPHGDVIRERLRARAKDKTADPADRKAAAEAL